VHAGDLPRLAGVDGLDAGVRQRAAQDLHVQHAGQRDVVGVVALAADEPAVLDPLAACAEAADLDLVYCLRHGTHPSWPPALSWPSWPAGLSARSFSAAQSTDLTMFW